MFTVVIMTLLVAIAALFFIGRSRSGASIGVEKILGFPSFAELTTIFFTALAAATIAFVPSVQLANTIGKFLPRLNYRALSCATILFLSLFISALGGLPLALTLAVTSAIGYATLKLNIRRTTLMAVLLLPTTAFFLGQPLPLMPPISLPVFAIHPPLQFSAASLTLLLATLPAISAYFLYRTSPRLAMAIGGAFLALYTLTSPFESHDTTTPTTATQTTDTTTASGPFRITRVIDGDTIELADKRKIRLLGINTPELKSTDPQEKQAAVAARQFLEQLVQTHQNEIYLEYDQVKTDKYGRTLAYVYVRKNQALYSLNGEILRQKHATPLFIAPNLKYYREFLNLYFTDQKSDTAAANSE